MRRTIRELVIDGVTLQAPGPLGCVTLRFTPGVDVLYGLNGAGKSRILQSLLNTLDAGDGGEGGVAHLLRKDVVAELEEDELKQDELECMTPGPWWYNQLIHEAAEAGSRVNTPEWCPWVHAPDVDWFTYLVASVSWNQLVQSGLDQEPAAQLTWATVSQGRFALEWTQGGWNLLVCARADDSHESYRSLLNDLEAAVARPDSNAAAPNDPQGRSRRSLVDEVKAALARRAAAAPNDPQVWGLLEDPRSRINPRLLLNHPWAAVPLFFTGIWMKSYASCLLPAASETGTAADLNRKSSDALLEFVKDESFSESLRVRGLDAVLEPRDQPPAMDDRNAVEMHGVAWLHAVRSGANRTFANLLTDAPPLNLQVRGAHDWYQGKPPLRWWVEDPSGEEVELEDLSTAQKRWSALAIQLAINALRTDTDDAAATRRLLVLDEPEAALHASAQRFLAQGIGHLAPDLQVIVVSHSPTFLDHTDFRLHHVHRGAYGRTELTPLVGDQLKAVRSLGMSPADLFQHIRLFVVVEGRHDEVVLNACVGEELDGIGATIIPMGGATKLSPVLDSRLIFDYTDAKVLVVIDSTDGEVRAIWKRAIEAARSGAPSTARGALEELKRDGEQGFIRNFGIRAVDLGQTERIDLFGLSRPDILRYLPPTFVVPKAAGRDWDRLRADSGSKTETAFKKWLRDNLGLIDDDSGLMDAISQLDEVPEDFLGLVAKATQIARDPWWRHSLA